MKLPSVNALIQATIATCKRFPLAIAFTIAGCFYFIRINHLSYELDDRHHYFENIVMSCYLGMLLAIVLSVYNERNKHATGTRLVMHIVAVVLIVIYYYTLPDHFNVSGTLRFTLFVIGLHLLIAFVPFTEKGELNGFWQYNKTIFLRILTAGLYSAVLYLGLSLAMLAIEKLFKVEINSRWYMDLWICIAGIFNTIFFLAGFPSGFESLESKTNYPKGLKIFTQYVLLPIITVYLLILYAYMLKIVFTRQWPYGWVSYLVLAFAIAGILSLLLIHPVRYDENNKWILGFSRFFYFAICPLIILLFLAIERRIGDYGITNERYFVLVLTCWLAFIALYFLVSKKKNIKIIPVSLCILTFLASFGPWGAFSISLKSQSNRLKQFLSKNNLLQNQKVIPAKTKLAAADAQQITSIVRYLANAYGYSTLQPFFSQNLDSLMKADKGINIRYSFEQSEKLLSLMGVDEQNEGFAGKGQKMFAFTSNDQQDITDITGYNYLISGYDINNYDKTDTLFRNYLPGNQPLKITFVPGTGKVLLQTTNGDPITIDVSLLVKSLKEKAYTRYSTISQDSMTLSTENNDMFVKFIFKNIYGEADNSDINIQQFRADMLIRIKDPLLGPPH